MHTVKLLMDAQEEEASCRESAKRTHTHTHSLVCGVNTQQPGVALNYSFLFVRLCALSLSPPPPTFHWGGGGKLPGSLPCRVGGLSACGSGCLFARTCPPRHLQRYILHFYTIQLPEIINIIIQWNINVCQNMVRCCCQC